MDDSGFQLSAPMAVWDLLLGTCEHAPSAKTRVRFRGQVEDDDREDGGAWWPPSADELSTRGQGAV